MTKYDLNDGIKINKPNYLNEVEKPYEIIVSREDLSKLVNRDFKLKNKLETKSDLKVGINIPGTIHTSHFPMEYSRRCDWSIAKFSLPQLYDALLRHVDLERSGMFDRYFTDKPELKRFLNEDGTLEGFMGKVKLKED